jgi:hypothetical protein
VTAAAQRNNADSTMGTVRPLDAAAFAGGGGTGGVAAGVLASVVS